MKDIVTCGKEREEGTTPSLKGTLWFHAVLRIARCQHSIRNCGCEVSPEGEPNVQTSPAGHLREIGGGVSTGEESSVGGGVKTSG